MAAVPASPGMGVATSAGPASPAVGFVAAALHRTPIAPMPAIPTKIFVSFPFSPKINPLVLLFFSIVSTILAQFLN